MEISQALNQLAEIQDKLSRTQIYRGYRPVTVAISSGCALLAGGLSLFYPALFVWPAIAVLCLVASGAEMAYDYWANFSSHQQRLARQVLLQLLPGLFLGAVWSAIWMHSGNSPTLLPSLWAMTYAYSLLSSRPHLPAGLGYVAVFYGLCALTLATPWGASRFNLGMTLTFTLGQALLALILHWNQPRKENP